VNPKTLSYCCYVVGCAVCLAAVFLPSFLGALCLAFFAVAMYEAYRLNVKAKKMLKRAKQKEESRKLQNQE
jgi:Flp pilus assembly protein TadB